MRELTQLIRELARDENGNSVSEYAMILAVTVVAVAAGLNSIEHPISAFFQEAGNLFDLLIAGE